MKIAQEVIKEHRFFRGMKPEYLEMVASGSAEVKFEANEIVFREGQPAGQFYLIESGQVALEVHEANRGAIRVQTLGPGEVLGWSWMFPPFVWHFQARALEPTTAIALNGGRLLRKAEDDKAFGYDLMKRVAQVLIERLQATRRRVASQPAKATVSV